MVYLLFSFLVYYDILLLSNVYLFLMPNKLSYCIYEKQLLSKDDSVSVRKI